MKRFVIDFLLILMLVMIGSSISLNEPIENKIEEYEQNLQIPISKMNSNNKVTHVIKKSGEIVESVLEVSVEVISSIFKAVIE